MIRRPVNLMLNESSQISALNSSRPLTPSINEDKSMLNSNMGAPLSSSRQNSRHPSPRPENDAGDKNAQKLFSQASLANFAPERKSPIPSPFEQKIKRDIKRGSLSKNEPVKFRTFAEATSKDIQHSNKSMNINLQRRVK